MKVDAPMKQPLAIVRSLSPVLRRVGAGLALMTLTASCGQLQKHFQKSEESAPDRKAPVPSEANAQVEFKPLQEESVGKVLVTSARVAWDENRVAHVFPPVTGRVVEIAAQLGDFVKKGQKLATIMSPDLGSAVSDMNKAKAALIAADHDVKRQRELFKLHAVSAAVLEASEDNYGICLAEMQRAEQKAALLREAGVDAVTQTYQLYAPIDGQILARQINPGMEVQGMYSGGTTAELYTVGLADALWVLADVYEQDMARVKVGAPVEVRTVAYPDKPLKGTIDWVSDALDPAMRTVTVRCTLENKDRLLKPQMYATVGIETEGRKILAIARESLVHLGEKTVVITADVGANRFERKPVIVDEAETGNWVPVLHGVEAGEKVVTRGALLLSEAIN
jgi:cobalt-zinc-cadmium efflux system membrane fusion protein